MGPLVVAVTGASSGVGRATAHAFARGGATVGLIARGEEALEATAAEVKALGGTPVRLVCDVADAGAVEAAAEELERHAAIDVWVNNAMASVFAPTWEISAAEFKRVTEVTYLGVVNGTLSALARMRARDRGVIVQVGSALAYRGIPLQSPYCASKHAIQGFNESLRCELMSEHSGVRVTMVQLPALNTPQFDTVRTRLPRHPQPVPPIYQPEVAARAIVTAARHPARREWWVGGSTMVTLLGNAIAPGLGDRYLARTGVDAQQTDQTVQKDRPDNLVEPVPGPGATHGDFDQRATDRSLQWLATRHRRVLAAVVGTVTTMGTAGALTRRR
ncbi:MAG TPA: SDR family oxidoreductase [Solirubrobacteraceae bacterium]|jgi:NADP-dependent 3-hydroxy acid dehydrogenase YdfG|nr:SDR family oxidoreductase [Solirubrobacteraceae bacterium]